MRVDVGDTIKIVVEGVPVTADWESLKVDDIFEDEGVKILSVSHEKQ